jgi:hypothetical protein
MTHVHDQNTRIFYLLDDDPLFLDLVDWPAMWPYVTGLLNERPHHHASDAIVEYGPRGRSMGWHQDGHDNAFRGLGSPIPLLQLKVGYSLTDMTEGGQGNLCVVPSSHKTNSTGAIPRRFTTRSLRSAAACSMDSSSTLRSCGGGSG